MRLPEDSRTLYGKVIICISNHGYKLENTGRRFGQAYQDLVVLTDRHGWHIFILVYPAQLAHFEYLT